MTQNSRQNNLLDAEADTIQENSYISTPIENHKIEPPPNNLVHSIAEQIRINSYISTPDDINQMKIH